MIDFNFFQINIISIKDKYEDKTGNKNNQISIADEILKDRKDNLNEDYFKACIFDISNINDIL